MLTAIGQGHALVPPGRGLRAGAVHDPVGEPDDELGRLGGGHERARRQEAAHRVLPADERLDARDRAVGGADLGLVVEDELAVVDRVPELGHEREPVGVEALLARART